jgi:hypothetical protein
MRLKNCSGRRKRTPGEPFPRCGFTEDDIRKKIAQEEQWDELSDDEQREAIRLLMDASEYVT